MLRNYLITALRNLIRNRLYAAINIAGLAVGFAAALLIALFLRDEFSYDKWLPDYERTFLVSTRNVQGDGEVWSVDNSQAEIAAWLKLDFPDIESVARIDRERHGFRHGDIESNETAMYWADASLFSVLRLPVAYGDVTHALERPNSIVLTRRMARKYFGRDNPIGETIELDRHIPMEVTAIIEDLPANSHLQIDIIASGNTSESILAKLDSQPPPSAVGNNNTNVYTYVRLAAGAKGDDLRKQMPDFIIRHEPKVIAGQPQSSFPITRVDAIHLSPSPVAGIKPRGDIATDAGLAIVAVFILLVAAINFVNLMTARAARRAVEVGVRKTAGAFRRDLIVQFIGESLIYGFIAMIVAVAAVCALLPAFNASFDRQIAFTFWRDPLLGLGIPTLMSVVGISAGFYPAFVLSSFHPVSAFDHGFARKPGLQVVRHALVLVQFAILIALIVATYVVYRQTLYATNEGLRLSTDQVLIVEAPCRKSFADEIAALPGVAGIACTDSRTFSINGNGSASTASIAGQPKFDLSFSAVDAEFFKLFGLQPLAGRTFSRDRDDDTLPQELGDSTQLRAVINEAAARALGFSSPSDAVGNSFSFTGFSPPENSRQVEIIGVVPNFMAETVERTIQPAGFFFRPAEFNILAVKLRGQDIAQSLTAIDGLWQKLGESRPIRRYFFNTYVQGLYLNIIRQSYMLSVASGIAMFLACLGMFGLSAFTAERRTKEIGIRKAMGASRTDILRMLIWQFAKPVLWANLIAWPVAGYLMNRWLHGFAYHIDLDPLIFVGASVAVLVIALATVASHALLVARAKPVAALRYE